MDISKIILSIDYSLNGSAFWVGDGTLSNTTYYYFSNLRTDFKNEHCIPIQEGSSSTDKLDNVICFFLSKIKDIDLVVLESASFSSVNSSTDFKAGYNIITYLCRRLNIEYIEVSPITNKLFFTSNAKAEKIDMVNQSIKEYGNKIDFESVSRKHREDLADSLSLFTIGVDYLKSYRLPAPKGYIDTQDVKYFETLPLNRQMVISKLYNRDDLYNEAKKQRDKIKRLDKNK